MANDVILTLLGALLGGGIGSTVMGLILLRRTKLIEGEIGARFDEQLSVFQSTRLWRERALAELFGPLQMNFARTGAAFPRWDRKNLYLEGQVVRTGNETIRDLLLAKGHLIPPHLVESATQLVVHYDVWMEAYDRLRRSSEGDDGSAFVFVGPAGYPLPRTPRRRLRRSPTV